MIHVDREAGTTAVGCDRCRAICDRSVVYGIDRDDRIEWFGITAISLAIDAGWHRRFRGRVAHWTCLPCHGAGEA